MKSRKGSLGVFPVYVYFTIVLRPFEQQKLMMFTGMKPRVKSLPKKKILGLTKIESICETNYTWFQRCIPALNGLKTLLEKEKMLVTNIFSFPHNVFKWSLSQGH